MVELGDAEIEHVARIARRLLAAKLAANDRLQPVGAHQHVAPRLALVGEQGDHAVRVLAIGAAARVEAQEVGYRRRGAGCSARVTPVTLTPNRSFISRTGHDPSGSSRHERHSISLIGTPTAPSSTSIRLRASSALCQSTIPPPCCRAPASGLRSASTTSAPAPQAD